MMYLTRGIFRKIAHDTRGAEIAEAAAVLPLMFMVLLGIFWFGQAFSLYGTITRAAQEGARAGAAPYCTTCSSPQTAAANAEAAVKSAMTIANLDFTKAQQPASPPSFPAGSCGATPPCDSGSSNFCVQTPVQLTNAGAGDTPVCGISVSFQYPFSFNLPFSSLNKQTIWLQASARMRMETQ